MEEVKKVIESGKDIYDILDTAIKIGLGAFIGGVFSYLSIKSNQQNEVKKEKRTFKIKTLDEASSTIEEYFNSSISLLDFYFGLRYEDISDIYSLNPTKKEKYLELDNNYKEGMNKAYLANSKFNIIGLEEIQYLVAKIDQKVIHIRNNFILGNDDLPSKENLEQTINEIIDLKNECHKKINLFFENLE